ncbi:uncharacterized protein LOC135819543 [Sycon ciliatum]|uniref:uncharacterized protein LOC135819543 n=1 Tax=Sycon ciliatum TaxID=27933 RepID=UPI0031F71F9E|eukprot:scpid62686/ scgid2069/ Serine carboxypeptidase-like 21
MSRIVPVSLLLICLAAQQSETVADSSSDPHSDAVVQSLPGWSGPLPSKHYSGYVDIDSGRMHYVFVESENNCLSQQQDQVPLVLWVQGGPGCSSLMGFFTEVGTFQVATEHNNDSSLRLELNAHRWSKCAHMLYWESPVGVGFSYSPSKHYKTNDSHVADMNLQFLVNWFKEFPEYANLDFYIAGESYAGVYIPMLATRVQERNAEHSRPHDQARINLRGILVGNGCIGNAIGACSAAYYLVYAIPYLFHHALVGDADYAGVQSACAGMRTPDTDACVSAVNTLYSHIGNVDTLNVLGSCKVNMSASAADGGAGTAVSLWYLLRKGTSHGVHDLPDCPVAPLVQRYLRRDDVQQALHVEHSTPLAAWSGCSADLHALYGETVTSVLPDYVNMLGDYRILIYNGDADASVPFTDNKEWTESFAAQMGLVVSYPWQPWLTELGQVGGYMTGYTKDFTFMTVRGAGHMVPMLKPAPALEMFTRFIQNSL